MSTMPSIYSDELITALAVGKWWAMVEVSSPISEEPEYGGYISGQWGDLVEAQETSCPTSLVFSDASEKAQRRSQHSGFSDATRKTTKQSRQKIAKGGPVPARSKQGAPVPANSEKGDLSSSLVFSDTSEQAPNSSFSDATLKNMEQRRKKKSQVAPVPDGSPHGTPVAAPKDNVGLCQAPPQKLCVEIDNLTEKMQQLNLNLESHNHQAPQTKPRIRSSLRRGSQLSRKRASDNAGVDPKGVPVHSGTPQGAPVPDGSPHGTPVAAPKDNVGLCQAPPQKLCVETDNLNEKTQQLNFNLESHNHQAPQTKPRIRSSLRRGSQLSRKRASDNAGVDPKGVPGHSGTPQGAPVPDGSPHGTPVAAPKDNVGLCQAPPQKLCVETDNLNEKTQQLNFNLESHNHQAPQTKPRIRSSLRRGSQLSQKRASDNAGVDPKGVLVHSGTPQGAPVPTGYPQQGAKHEIPLHLCYPLLLQKPQASCHLAQRTQTRSHLTRKRALDNAGVDQSPPQKKQRMAIEVKVQQSEQGSLEQMDHLYKKV
ncbi:histone acetyltransferase p300-like [Ctenopharyngodon idella]|uniref:histone acetyltransferase p300-like n=1 Tax=Ctenopharyngodon idella TaxID=7959 RepID=UPI002231774D|nr:histone acetyltransferase p300-like [Ctenopharyngodon idella]